MFGTKKDIDAVLGQLGKTLDDLQIVADQQEAIANEQQVIMAAAIAARNDADEIQQRALRVSLKLADLLA